MRRWYGVRRLYETGFRERLLLALVLVICCYYVLWSIEQWFSLDAAALRFDFVNYFGGAQAAAHGGDIYADFKRSWGTQAWVVAYIYPPFFALLLAPLTPLGLVAAGRIWLLFVHLAFVLALTLILRAHPELSKTGRRLFLLAALSFMPVYLNLKFQQVATLWLLLLVGTLLAALRRRESTAGLLLALAASLKVTPVFLIPLLFRLRRRRLALLGAAMLALVTAITVLASPGSWQFFTVVLPRIGLGTANWDNGSIDGLVSRVVEYAPGIAGSATQPLAKFVIAVAVVVVIGWTLWSARGGADSAWTLRLGFAALITSLLIVSSVTWQHHLVTLLLPIATAIAWITARHAPARYGWWLAAAYALCWMDRRAFPLPSDLLVHSPLQAALVLLGTSVKLAGLLLVWALLLRMLAYERHLSLRLRPPYAATRAGQPAA
ncbi:MAG TPA: glycosyltransferase family 87 protein [Candidatus Dormibacteraeota bacterium]